MKDLILFCSLTLTGQTNGRSGTEELALKSRSDLHHTDGRLKQHEQESAVADKVMDDTGRNGPLLSGEVVASDSHMCIHSDQVESSTYIQTYINTCIHKYGIYPYIHITHTYIAYSFQPVLILCANGT